MTPDEYEALVAEIASGVRDSAPELRELVIGSGRRNKIQGASSYRHQIDVSLIDKSGLFLIECKRWEYKLGVEEVMVLAARATDIAQANSGCTVHSILVSKLGPTAGARTLAEFFGIEIEVVLSAHEFGLRLGDRVHVGASDSAEFRDEATTTITRNGVVID